MKELQGRRVDRGSLLWLKACFLAVACFFILSSVSVLEAGTRADTPNTPITFELYLSEGNAPLLRASLSASDTYNTGFDGGSIYLSCYSGRFDYFRLNLVLHTNIAFVFERYPRAFVGIKNIDPSNFVQFSGEVEGTGEEEALPLLFKFLDDAVAFQKAVGVWDEYEAGDENRLYVSSYPDFEFFQNFTSSNVINLMFYDKDRGTFSSSLGVLYTLDDAVVGQFEAECRKG